MQEKPRISQAEYIHRIITIQNLMKEHEVDILLAFANEAEPQFVRYLSNYWPSFETAGVLMGQTGDPILLIGPESLTYAKDRSTIKEIRRIQSFRESSNPEYPGVELDTFIESIKNVLHGAPLKHASIAGYNIISHLVYKDFEKAVTSLGCSSINSGDELIMKPRMIKSDQEILCIKEASRISHEAMKYTIEHIQPGMTELQVRGLGVQKIYELGGENEAYPMWVLSGNGGDQAISRARQKVIQKGELVHIGVGARYEGYASSIGRQVIIGPAQKWMTDAINTAYGAHELISEQLYAGNNAGVVAKKYMNYMEKRGYSDWLLYGPCHATGLMEGEPPWIESNSDYILKENMTYCIDIFMKDTKGHGLRVEDSVRVGAHGAENLTNFPKDIIIL